MSKLKTVSYEEALTLTGFGKFNLLTFLLASSIVMSMAFEMLSVAYLVPASACELLTTSTDQGLMAAVPLIGIILTSYFWGYMGDTRGRKKVLCICMTTSSIASILAAFSPDWITFSVLKFISSGSVSGALALALTLLSECTPAAKRSILIMLTSSFFLGSTGIMAIVAIPVLPLKFHYYVPFLNIQFNSWRTLSLIFSTPCVLSAIGLLFLCESPKYLLSVGKDEKALKIMRTIFSINNNKSRDDYPVKCLVLDELTASHAPKGFFSSVASQTIPLFKPPLLKNTVLLCAMMIIVLLCMQPYLVWFPYLINGFMTSVQRGEESLTICQRLRASQNMTETTVNDCSINEFALSMLSGMGFLLAVINTVLSFLINYFGRRRLIIIVQFIAGIGGICLNSSKLWQLSGLLLFVFIAGILNFGMVTTVSVDLFPTHVKAMAVSLTMMIGRVSAVVGINILKLLLEVNCEASFYMFGAVTLLGVAVSFLLPKDRKPSSRNCTET
ncbi:hypothetical protein evm_011970 [Chilo suppressalis]|nr:hypothetical protein evm_011970 [Chilo suppressalis]